jgi:N-acyl-D-amino-acid deacylase
MEYDTVLRGGTIVDGTGAEPYIGDVALLGNKIVAVGEVAGPGNREIQAEGLLVTPGFVDIHTHYDGQAIWSDRLNPSSAHGVTTAVMGNCGVGFAPCRKADHDLLVDVMSGVEDIPGVVMAEGLPWNWESFPEYLDAVAARKRDIDVAAFLPHSPLRVYVMGERGANREPATVDDLRQMRQLAREAIEAGALGFASSRLMMHRTGGGEAIPSYDVAEDEVRAIALGVRDAGGGLLQFVPDIPLAGYEPILAPMFRAAQAAGLPLTFTLGTGNVGDPIWQGAMTLVEDANAAGGKVTAQVFPRPIGLMMGLELTVNPFSLCPSYQAIAHLPLGERVAAMRTPALRARLLEEPQNSGHPLAMMARNWEWMFPMQSPPDYEPPAADSMAARAAAAGVAVEEFVYDFLLEDAGHSMILLALGNFPGGSLDTIGQLIGRDDVVVGLGDGGAHYGMICDSSFPTFMLAHWARDRKQGLMAVAEVVKNLTSAPAAVVGLLDRGRIAPGYKADLNLIDHAKMRLRKPEMLADLPGGGQRLDQGAEGYVATFVSGEMIAENGLPTRARPGLLVRGRQMAPA